MNVRDLAPRPRGERDRDPTNPLLTLHRKMNRRFDDLVRGLGTTAQAWIRNGVLRATAPRPAQGRPRLKPVPISQTSRAH